MVSFEILIGLPASGKTYYAKNREEEDNVIRFDADSFAFGGGTIETLISVLKELTFDEDTTVIVDGLFFVKEAEKIYSALPNTKYTLFKTPKEICFKNDRYRVQNSERNESCTGTIRRYYGKQGVIISDIDTIINKSTPFLLDILFRENNKMLSEHWDAGGSIYASCWDDEDTVHEPSAGETNLDKKDFGEFFEYIRTLEVLSDDEAIDKYWDLVEIEEESESDYYGGCEYREFYIVNKTDILSVFLGNVDKYTLTEEFKEKRPGDFLCLTL